MTAKELVNHILDNMSRGYLEEDAQVVFEFKDEGGNWTQSSNLCIYPDDNTLRIQKVAE